ncbi:MAG: metal ABC transporter solute-binding protein, Zn/Mn family [Candidatus Dormibacteria bacterium]
MATILEKPIPQDPGRHRQLRLVAVAWLIAAALAGATMTACGYTPGGSSAGGRLPVVAAENVWGSIAAQVGGNRVSVVSVINNPATDPHGYEPPPEGGRAIAGARYVVVNGAGYDTWAASLLDANPAAGRRALSIAGLAGRREGDNPHMWYSPEVVGRAVDRMAGDYAALDPAGATYFQERAARYRGDGLKRYDALLASIRTLHGGAPVGSTESIFMDLARSLGLSLVTPPEYMRATSEGDEPTAAVRTVMDDQISRREIRALVFNRQNSTPDIQGVMDRARRQGIPVVAMTETLDPPGATFQDWQAAQLQNLQRALSESGHR